MSAVWRGLAVPAGRRLTHQGTELAKGAQYSTTHPPHSWTTWSFVHNLLLVTVPWQELMVSSSWFTGKWGEKGEAGIQQLLLDKQTQFCIGALWAPIWINCLLSQEKLLFLPKRWHKSNYLKPTFWLQIYPIWVEWGKKTDWTWIKITSLIPI